MPALAVAAGVAGSGRCSQAVARSGRPVRARAGGGDSVDGRLAQASMSKIGLAPLSMAGDPEAAVLPSALDDAEDSKPYVLEKPDRRDAQGTGAGLPTSCWPPGDTKWA